MRASFETWRLLLAIVGVGTLQTPDGGVAGVGVVAVGFWGGWDGMMSLHRMVWHAGKDGLETRYGVYTPAIRSRSPRRRYPIFLSARSCSSL